MDSKIEGSISIPAMLGQPGRFPAEALRVEWQESARPGFCKLEISISTPDKFLPGWVSAELASLPLPQGAGPLSPKVIVSGALPIWLHMAYSCWLRSQPGVESIGVWDARNTTEIIVGPQEGDGLPALRLMPAMICYPCDSFVPLRGHRGPF